MCKSWRSKVTTAEENNLREPFAWFWGRMKALQKNQGRTDQMLGAMADMLTSVAMPNQWVSCRSVCVFTGCLYESIKPQIQKESKRYIQRYSSGLARHDAYFWPKSLHTKFILCQLHNFVINLKWASQTSREREIERERDGRIAFCSVLRRNLGCFRRTGSNVVVIKPSNYKQTAVRV